MVDSSIKPDAIQIQLRYVAVQRMLGTAQMTLLHDDEIRAVPAKVYPAVKDSEDWIVEPPAGGTSAVVELKTFTGRAALLQAMQYAHDTYGCARFLSR